MLIHLTVLIITHDKFFSFMADYNNSLVALVAAAIRSHSRILETYYQVDVIHHEFLRMNNCEGNNLSFGLATTIGALHRRMSL